MCVSVIDVSLNKIGYKAKPFQWVVSSVPSVPLKEVALLCSSAAAVVAASPPPQAGRQALAPVHIEHCPGQCFPAAPAALYDHQQTGQPRKQFQSKSILDGLIIK